MKARLLMALLVVTVCAANGEPPRIRLGGVSAAGGYWGAPAWWGPGYGWSPMYYGAWVHPGYWGGFVQGPALGEVKLPKLDNAMVFLDGAYAGPAEKLRSMWLEPGKYDLEVKHDNGRTWQRRIYVLSGKTLDLKEASIR